MKIYAVKNDEGKFQSGSVDQDLAQKFTLA